MLYYFVFAILIIILFYLLMIMPKLKRNPDSKKLDGWLYAHRGLHDNKGDAPENSLRAFRLAVENGYGIELDVQLTKDGIVVVHHDYNLKRSCYADLKIAELEFKDLQDYCLFDSNEKIPTLEEVLSLVDGKVPLIIELKIPFKADKLCEVVSNMLNQYHGVYCIESFNPFGLAWYRKHEPNVVRGQLSTDFIREKVEGDKFQYFVLKNLLLNFYTKPDFIAYHYVYKKGLSCTLCRKLYRVKTVAWTIKSQKVYEENRKYYELFIFDSFIPEIEEKTITH
jgi:Glycerophosphoryl diester phosphodiesterase